MSFSLFKLFSNPESRSLSNTIKLMTKLRPHNITLYKVAFQHSSSDNTKYSNERLEFLGDAVLSLIIGEYLFKQYPLKDEGFLTEIRSRIVNRESLGMLAKKIGIDSVLRYEEGVQKGSIRFVYGNALEALIGAIYIDRGYKLCYKFVVDHLLHIHIDLEKLIATDSNYKSQIVEWGNKNQKRVYFQLVDEKSSEGHKEFTAQIVVDEKVIAQGQGRSRKQAEQHAALKALEALDQVLN